MAIESFVLDADPVARMLTKFHFDHNEDEVIIQTVQDTTSIEELAKAQYNAHDTTKGWRGDYHMVGKIPLSILYDPKYSHLLTDEKAVLKWLEENPRFKTRPGRLI